MAYTTLSPEEIRAAVLKEAKKQFLQNGIANTQMKKIAEAVNIGRSTLYRYYTEKEQLAFLVTLQIIDEMIGQVLAKAHDETLSGIEQLRAFFEAYIDRLKANMDILRYFAEFDHIFEKDYPQFSEAEEFVKAMNRFSVLPSQFIIRGMNDGSIKTEEDPMILASVMLNAIMGTSVRVLPRSKHYKEEQGSSGEVIVNKTLELLLNAIKG